LLKTVILEKVCGILHSSPMPLEREKPGNKPAKKNVDETSHSEQPKSESQNTEVQGMQIYLHINKLTQTESQEGHNKTSKMLDIEQRKGESIEVLLRRMLDEQKTYEEIATALEVTDSTIYNWVNLFNLPTQPKNRSEISAKMWKNPEIRQKIIDGQRADWQDPVRREAKINKIQSPEARIKRGQSLKKYWNEHPERLKQLKVTLSQRETRKNHINDLFGEDPRIALFDLYWNEGFTVDEIAASIDIHRSTMLAYLTTENIPLRQRGEWVKPVEENDWILVQQAIDNGVFHQLKDSYQHVLLKRFPYEGKRFTLEEIATEFESSREWIRQVEKTGLEKLAALLRSEPTTKYEKRKKDAFGENPGQSLRAMVDEGLNIKGIAQRTGYSIGTIQTLLDTYGISREIFKRGRPSKKSDDNE
jgi:transposase